MNVSPFPSKTPEGASASRPVAVKAPGPRAVPKVLECPHCQEWQIAPHETYCGFCGRLLLRFSIEPEEDILVAIPSPAAREKTFVLKNDDDKPLDVSVGTASRNLSGLIIEPPRLTVPAGGEAKIVARLDEKKLPSRLQAETVQFRCMIGGDARKARAFRVTVKAGPRPVLVPKSLQFGQLEEGTSETKFLEIRNAGGIPLAIREIRSEGSSQLRVEKLPARVAIEPGSSRRVKVTWDTSVPETSDNTAKAGLRLTYRNVGQNNFVAARAKLYRFAIGIEPSQIDISPAFSKRDYIERVELRNRGTIDVDVVGIEADQEWIEIVNPHETFTLLSPNPPEERDVAPGGVSGEIFDFKVVCHPQDLEERQHEGKVTIWTANKANLTLTVRLEVVRPEDYAEYIGIDFGTTNSVVAIFNEARETIETVDVKDGLGNPSSLIPSVLAFGESPEQYKIGYEARSEAEIYPDRVVRSIKRIMGYDDPRAFFSRRFQPEQLASLLIRCLVSLAEARLHELTGKHYSAKKAIVTVPANFYDLQIQGVLVACALAGLDTEEKLAYKAAERLKDALNVNVNAGIILDEPSAAALYFLNHLTRLRLRPTSVYAFHFGVSWKKRNKLQESTDAEALRPFTKDRRSPLGAQEHLLLSSQPRRQKTSSVAGGLKGRDPEPARSYRLPGPGRSCRGRAGSRLDS